MIQTTTQEDLIRFIYQETSASENERISEALESNWNLKLLYSELLFAKSTLPDVNYTPSKSSIDIIMEYSKNSSVQKIH